VLKVGLTLAGMNCNIVGLGYLI